MSQFLFIGSTAPYSGKSAAILGLAAHLQAQGLRVAYGKPLAACMDGNCNRDGVDPDVTFIADWLGLQAEARLPTIARLDPDTVLAAVDRTGPTNYTPQLQNYREKFAADLALLEGPGDLQEGQLFHLSLVQMAETLDASVVLLARYTDAVVVDTLLSARDRLGDRLIGVVLNDVPEDITDTVKHHIVPYLEQQGIAVLGILPTNRILRSISVGELVHQLDAEVLCCDDRLDLLVEEITIGAMNVNSALKYFRKSEHKVVITGGDRTDIQLAALETSTNCLILTGQLPPTDLIRLRAEELEIPILSVDLDTLSTVERIERVFGQVRLHEEVKVQCVRDLIEQSFDFPRLFEKLQLPKPLAEVRTA
ncbi:phosphotransacetylase family protein [Synechococcus sp. PCC 7336]|uniref:phosphotransacetylase family protein n=1 Tax=Synechococcus sp. PCC 7336 TaxID=195250 RepID=UPI00034D6FE9|nr:phosphotransacetylase family protein [Synechococcus sp. PCC 7336]